MRHFAVLAVLVLTACCVGPPQPEPEQTPRVTPPPPPPPPATPPAPRPQGDEWRDWRLTPGDWTYSDAGAGSVARFGTAGMAPRLMLRCDPAGDRILLTLATMNPPPTARVTLTTTYGATGHAGIRSADFGSIDVVLAARDRTLDQMAFSRGRFMVAMADGPNLIVPAWPEMTRVIEDCRP